MRKRDTPQRGVFRFFLFTEGLGCEVENFAERDVFLYKAVFTSKEQLYLTMQHEYMHVGYNLAGLGGRPSSAHYGIRRWEYMQAEQWNFDALRRYNEWLMNDYRYFAPQYHHENFGIKIIKHRPK